MGSRRPEAGDGGASLGLSWPEGPGGLRHCSGLDTEAARGALGCARGVVVLAAMDVPALREYVSSGGCGRGGALERVPARYTAEGWHFPVRNRIISGKALGGGGGGVRSGTPSALTRPAFCCLKWMPQQGPTSSSRGPLGWSPARDVLREYEDRFPRQSPPPRAAGREAVSAHRAPGRGAG